MNSMIRMALIVVLAASVLCGCIDATTTVVVNPDGSGSVVQTTYMNPAVLAMMQGMGGGMGAPKLAQTPEQYAALAQRMGTGVSFQEVKELTRPDGASGSEATFAFSDIEQLRLSTAPPVPGPAGASKSAAEDNPVTFSLAKGAAPTLTIRMPRPKGGGEMPAQTQAIESVTPDPQQMAMMRRMFDGFRFRMLVRVNGRVESSTASYMEPAADGAAQVITLLDMDIGKLIADDATLKKLSAMGKIEDMDTARERLKDFPGLKIETAERVEVTFR